MNEAKDDTADVCGFVVAYTGQDHQHFCGSPTGHREAVHWCGTDGCTYMWVASFLREAAL